ncbi:MAG: hypothetical protein J6S33_02385 [Aeriscardovia sp.]|nr:hypothetical protein [Aeriscardovia sp.]
MANAAKNAVVTSFFVSVMFLLAQQDGDLVAGACVEQQAERLNGNHDRHGHARGSRGRGAELAYVEGVGEGCKPRR